MIIVLSLSVCDLAVTDGLNLCRLQNSCCLDRIDHAEEMQRLFNRSRATAYLRKLDAGAEADFASAFREMYGVEDA
jgi:hypothetical protein